MQDVIGNYIQRFLKNHEKRRKFISIFAVLAVLVASGVIWKMRLTGISMNADVQCGREEHTHDDSCYEMVLICGLNESEETEAEETPAAVHTHTAECYEEQQILLCSAAEHSHGEACYDEEGNLICEIPEHQHGEACYRTEQVLICGLEETAIPNEKVKKPESHVHTEACYEKRLICGKEEHTHTIECMCDKNADLETPADWEATLPELKHKWLEDFLAVADSQLGYQESSRNFVLDEDGKHTRGYTRYGQWYGNAYGDWCAMFVSWCLNYSEIPKEAIPYAAGCYAWTVELDKMGLYETSKSYVPEAGDIVFFYQKDRIGHVGIIESVDEKNEKLHTIEGNAGDAVTKQQYSLTNSSIAGYMNFKKAEMQYAVNYLDTMPEQTLTAELYADDTYRTRIVEDEVIKVSGKIPEGAAVKAYPVEDAEIEGKQILGAYDISIILQDGSIYEPEEPLKVNITLPKLEAEEAEKSSVYYIPEEGKAERIDTNIEETTAVFEAEHFSVYAVAYGTNITTLQELQDALASNAADTIVIGENIEISDEVKLNLNGHTIDASAGGFTVKDGGSLTITDSVGVTDTADAGVSTSANEAGKLATLKEDTLTYYVTETSVTDSVIGATTEKLVTHTVKLRGKITGKGVTVESGGSFTMDGGAICGVKDAYAVNSTGGTVTMNGGYICGNAGGIKADGGTVELDGGVIAGNKAEWGGGIHVENGQFHMFGGIISGNDARASGGGGVYVNQSTALLYHGYITNNEGADNTPEYTGGGGVLCHSGCTVEIMSGADYKEPMYITANKACSGGGITAYNMLNGVGNKITMNDGYVTGNLATKAEGGGMAIRAESTAIIVGGYITNNVKETAESWGGGGIFGQEYSGITILHALITENAAKGFGGGVTGCSTGTVLVQNTEGAAIYGNRADGSAEHMASSNKAQDHEALEDPVFMQGGTYQDYFCALVSMVKGEMLGGGSENWYGSADGERVNTDSKDDILTASIRMGLNADPTNEDIIKAQESARVFINGNSSDTHGGGLLANGVMTLGNNDDKFELPGSLTFNAKKALNGKFGEGKLADYRFGFRLLDENKNEISTAYNDKDGLISFPKIKYTEEGTYIYYMEELVPEYPSVTLDTTIWKFKVIVTKKSIVPKKGDHVSSYYLYQPTNCYIYRNDKLLNEWQSDSAVKEDSWVTEKEDGTTETINSVTDFHVDVFGLTSGEESIPYTFNNTFADKVSIEVHKKWEDADGNIPETPPEESVTVYLTKNGTKYTSNGEADKSPVKLNADNKWSYSWSELPGYEGNDRIIWGIEEEVPDGWEAHLSYEKKGEDGSEKPGNPSGPEAVTNPESGTEYYIGTGDSEHVITFEGSGGEWNTSIKYEPTNSIVNNPKFVINPLADGKFTIGNADSKYSGTSLVVKYNQWGPEVLAFSLTSASTFHIENGYLMVDVLKDDGTIAYSKYLTYKLVDGNWKAGVSDTPDLNNTFRLYTILDTPGGGNTPSGGANESVVTITNKPKREEQFYGFTVKKVDAEDKAKLLPGAYFQLTDGNGNIVTFTQDKSGVYHYDGHWNQIKDLVVGEDGTFRAEDLPKGDYILTEVKAPDGYTIPTGDAAKHNITLPSDNENLIITIENGKQTGYELPETGGSGTFLYLVCGFICIIIPFWYGLQLKHTAKKRKDSVSYQNQGVSTDKKSVIKHKLIKKEREL